MERRSGEFCANRVFLQRVGERGRAGERGREAHAGSEHSPREDNSGDSARKSRIFASAQFHAGPGGRARTASGLHRCICE